jgi:multisubunit Na+/H+ antiporter MnhG subunit
LAVFWFSGAIFILAQPDKTKVLHKATKPNCLAIMGNLLNYCGVIVPQFN